MRLCSRLQDRISSISRLFKAVLYELQPTQTRVWKGCAQDEFARCVAVVLHTGTDVSTATSSSSTPAVRLSLIHADWGVANQSIESEIQWVAKGRSDSHVIYAQVIPGMEHHHMKRVEREDYQQLFEIVSNNCSRNILSYKPSGNPLLHLVRSRCLEAVR